MNGPQVLTIKQSGKKFRGGLQSWQWGIFCPVADEIPVKLELSSGESC
jgi:hypothetical protein